MYEVEVRHVSNGIPLFSLKSFPGSKMFPRQKVMLKLQKGVAVVFGNICPQVNLVF
jgi:hypothetical protein